MLTNEGDISNCLGVNINRNSDGTFELSQLHRLEKIINHVRIEVSAIIKERERPSGKPLMHKDKYSLGIRYVCNYRAAVGMLSYLQGSTRPEISIYIHQCACFCNNPHLAHKLSVQRIENYLVRTSTYVDLPYVNLRLTTHGVFYRTNIEKFIECYVDADFVS